VLYAANIPRISITPTTISRAAVGTEFLSPYPSHIHGSPGNFPTNRLTVSIAPFQKSCFLCGDIMLNRENRTSISIFTLLNLKEVNRRQRTQKMLLCLDMWSSGQRDRQTRWSQYFATRCRRWSRIGWVRPVSACHAPVSPGSAEILARRGGKILSRQQIIKSTAIGAVRRALHLSSVVSFSSVSCTNSNLWYVPHSTQWHIRSVLLWNRGSRTWRDPRRTT